MKHAIIILLFLCFDTARAQEHGCALSKQKFAQALAKKAANPSQIQLMNQYDVTFHHIDLTIENDTTYINGFVRTVAKVVSNKMDTFGFELHSNHTIDSIIYQQHPVAFTHANNFVYVKLPASLNQNERIDLNIYYNGDAHVKGSSVMGAGLTTAKLTNWNNSITWSLSEPYAAYDWWPCKQSLEDKIDSTYIFITTSKENKVGSQGLLQQVVSLPNDKVRYEWKSFYPVAYYLISVSVGKYAEFTTYVHKEEGQEGPDSILIQDYIYDHPDVISTNKPILDQTANIMKAFVKLFGVYPFANEKYGHCFAPIWGAMEHQTMTTIGVVYFGIVAHELAHQWFGDHVTCRTWNDIWLNEGFASYAEYLALELLMPDEKMTEMEKVHNRIMQASNGSIWFEDASNINRIFDSRLTYAKGGAFVHILRFEINNDSLFFDILKSYMQQFASSTSTTLEFKMFLEQKSGRDFTTVFNQWFYGEGYPRFSTTWNQIGDTVYIKTDQQSSAS